MNRREFVKKTGGLICAANMGVFASSANGESEGSREMEGKSRLFWRTPSRNPGDRRNVLLILCDQFQFNVASYAGGAADTPNLQMLARESVNFRTACTTTALCSPARATLYTGRWGHRTGLDDNCYTWHSRLMGLDHSQTTLLEWAREKDYFTGYFGKWHLGPDGPVRRGVHRFPYGGIERGARPGVKPDFEAPKRYYNAARTFNEKPGFYETQQEIYDNSYTKRLALQGIEFLNEVPKTQLPFFLTISFPGPHPPYVVPQKYSIMYPYRNVRLPENLQDNLERKPAYQGDIMWPFHDVAHMTADDWRKCAAYYQGFCTMIDRAIGEIFDALKSSGLWENTMIVFVADHGDMIGAHGRYDKGPYAYDEVMRIPMLIRVPGTGQRDVSRHVSIMDLNQTISEWMELEPDMPAVDSRSLFPLMEQGNDGWSGPDEIFYRYEWYNGIWFGIRAIRTPEFKYCWNPAGIDELYDLKNDPIEMKNQIDRPEFNSVQKDLRNTVLSYLKDIDDPAYSRMKEYIKNGSGD